MATSSNCSLIRHPVYQFVHQQQCLTHTVYMQPWPSFVVQILSELSSNSRPLLALHQLDTEAFIHNYTFHKKMFYDFVSRGRSSSSRHGEQGNSFNFMDTSRSTARSSSQCRYSQSGYAPADYSRSRLQSSGYNAARPAIDRSGSTSSNRSIYGHGLNTRDLSPVRGSTRPRQGYQAWEDRPVSPLGSSRFERSREYPARQGREARTAYDTSSERGSSSAGHSFAVDRGYDGAFAINRSYDGMSNGYPEGNGLSRSNAVRGRTSERLQTRDRYEERPRMGSNFRFGGYGDRERF